MLQETTVNDQLGEKNSGHSLKQLLLSDELVIGDATGVAISSSWIRRRVTQIPALKKRNLKRLVRYGSTSVLALAISEVTLLLLYAHNVVGATSAALLANLSGTLPSYVLARYWIWSSADRRRPGRQAAFYWIISFVSMLVSSVATGQISHHTPRQHVLHLAVLGGSFLVITFVLWIAKYFVYERTIFKSEVALGTANTA